MNRSEKCDRQTQEPEIPVFEDKTGSYKGKIINNICFV